MVDEMKSEDTEARINAMRKLKIIAQALGPERTRKELIPYLNGASPPPIFDDSFSPFVGCRGAQLIFKCTCHEKSATPQLSRPPT